jgi:diguanylate cyclase (GGDEF)-like protein
VPVQTLLALIAIAVLANLALIAASPGRIRGLLRAVRLGPGRASSGIPVLPVTDAGPDEPGRAASDSPPEAELRPAALDRVVRVATWVFLFAVTSLVLVADVWADRREPVLALLGGAALYALMLHGRIRRVVAPERALAIEGVLSLGFAGALVALTGGASSPFFFAFPLIVVGAAIVVEPAVTLALTAGAGAAYVVAIIAAVPAAIAPAEVAAAGVNLAALCLVAYVGMALGREQRRVRDEAYRRATVDPLTGLRTRAFLFGVLERELIRSQRTGRGFCLLMLDLDELKAINDRHGHLQGDRALQSVGEVIRAGIRRIDTGARFGGDEFVVLLPETDPTGGWVLAEKMRQGVADAGIMVNGVSVATSVSVGLVSYPGDGETVGQLLERADDAMYRSKRAGRDRITGIPVMDDDGARGGVASGVPTEGERNPV